MVNDPLNSIRTELMMSGWSFHGTQSADHEILVSELRRIAGLLGKRVASRRSVEAEVIRPLEKTAAHPRSLSARYGLGVLPFHVELSHRLRPCRFVVLGCIDPGPLEAPSMLLDREKLGLSPEELQLLASAPVFVRTGRHSFYSTLLSPDGAYLRYDPACIEAVNERGRAALQVLERRIQAATPSIHSWNRGDIVVIDNWRTLHGRAEASQAKRRRLMRVLLDAR